jgi:hypothetical protein
MHDDELTPEERDALAALRRDEPHNDLLEERTVRTLASRGLLHGRRRSRRWGWAAAAAACAVFFAGGFTLGRTKSNDAPERTTVYSGEMRDDSQESGDAPTGAGGTGAPSDISFAHADSTQAAVMHTVVWF